MRRRVVLSLLFLEFLGAAGGGGLAAQADAPGLCRQSYEFGNSGCAEIAVRVVGRRGQPLRDVYVTAFNAVDPARRVVLAGGYARPDSAGDYRLRLLRMSRAPTLPRDTLSVWLRAVLPSPGGRLADSVVVRLEFMAIGRPAKAVRAAPIALPAP